MNLKARLWFDHCVLREQFLHFFPTREFGSYAAFGSAAGDCIKSEPRTRVVILKRSLLHAKQFERFIFKEYHYPFLPRLRTWLRHSKAEHEFRSLLEVTSLGINAAEPVAFGTRRTLFGYVRSCFIITRYVENSCTLKQWCEGADKIGLTSAELNWSVCGALGQTFRSLHQGRFFLFTAKPRNILLRRTTNAPEIIIIDIPYALGITEQPLTRWAQALDLSMFLSNFEQVSSENQEVAFYNAYLPDPLGAPPEDLKRRVRNAIRWRRNQTPISSLVHRFRGGIKRWLRQKQKRTTNSVGSLKLLFALFDLWCISLFIQLVQRILSKSV